MNVVEKARALRAKVEEMAKSLDDTEALEVPEAFPKWSGNGVSYTTGDRVRYDDVLYTVLQSHISQEDWIPTDAVSLFAKVLIPDQNIVPEWEQPDSTNPYMKGDHVLYNGTEYESAIDNNVWSPSEYPAGWIQI